MTTEAELVDALKSTLSALVASVSTLIRAEDMKTRPSKAVASDSMFLQMLRDYDKATIAARAALARSDAPNTAQEMQQALRDILFMRPAGPVEKTKNAWKIIEAIENRAKDALARAETSQGGQGNG